MIISYDPLGRGGRTSKKSYDTIEDHDSGVECVGNFVCAQVSSASKHPVIIMAPSQPEPKPQNWQWLVARFQNQPGSQDC